jgi:hypothetical protein
MDSSSSAASVAMARADRDVAEWVAARSSRTARPESLAVRHQQLDGSRSISQPGVGELSVALIGNMF